MSELYPKDREVEYEKLCPKCQKVTTFWEVLSSIFGDPNLGDNIVVSRCKICDYDDTPPTLTDILTENPNAFPNIRNAIAEDEALEEVSRILKENH